MGGDDDEEIDMNGDQQTYIPIDDDIKYADDSDEQFELDKDGNILISPRSPPLKRQKSQGLECWTCSSCKATNKLSWTLTKFAMKCCICKQDTYTPTVEIFESTEWDEPSNDFWECTRCTLHNLIGCNECNACGQVMGMASDESDDETNGHGEFIKEDSSDDDDADGAAAAAGGMNMGHGMAMSGMFGNFMSRGMHGMGSSNHRRKPMRRSQSQSLRPFSDKKEGNLRNFLIILMHITRHLIVGIGICFVVNLWQKRMIW